MAYAASVFDEMMELIATGAPVRQICLMEGMPSQAQFYKWLQDDTEKSEKYARAKELQADYFAEEIIDIADNSTNDWMIREGKEVVDQEAIQRDRLRIDTRKWLMGKCKPKKYGDKLDHTSSDGTMSPKAADTDAIRNAVREAIRSTHAATDA